ncbi:metallopeptidase family protein [Erythrobacter litoralis]|uniref:metallopeptidase family protein n=1 Tax=Erythrobacter litoralis TaxID=39960 RepID=UPI0024358BB8|nr:metallopeptidase family protein [Erythrobacter litoralis]MDG6079800.1 metallopeptidase family protein [Erythrobacter litoralis]
MDDQEFDSAAMQRMAERALATLPEQFRADLADIMLRVVDFATPEQLAAVDLENKWHLSGLYEGQPVPDQSVWESGRMPPRIWLFRRPLIAEWRETGVRMDDLVRHVVIHEAGHHFGFSDDDMHRLEDQAD